MLKNIKFKGGFFTEETDLELFSNEARLAIIYGKNGSGKSTISNALKKIKGEEVDSIVQAKGFSQDNKEISNLQHLHIFNEEYINSRVKIRDNGLNSIVLLGELGDIEDKIFELELKKDVAFNQNEKLKLEYEEYEDIKNLKSPDNCKKQICDNLSTKWAERYKKIKDNSRKPSVDKVFDEIVNLCPTKSLLELQESYEDNFQLLVQIRKNELVQIENIPELKLDYDESKIKSLISKKIENPILSDRERNIFRLIEDEEIEQIKKMEYMFSKKEVTECPFCFQKVSEELKKDLITSIEKILSKEVEVHKENLKECIIKKVDVDFSDAYILDSKNAIKCQEAIDKINHEIYKLEEVIFKKINHPYKPIVDFNCELDDKIKDYEFFRGKLQQEIEKYNNAVFKAKKIEEELIGYNLGIAYYEVSRDIDLWKKSLKERDEIYEKLEASNQEISSLENQINMLKSYKKNIKIAVDLINKSLRYVFFSKERLKIKIEDDKYILYSRGKSVSPSNVSVGERNIIALCYYFIELRMNQETKNGYSNKLTLVIDDPISSFDFENKIGVISFLKSKISDVIKGNPESQILLFTHDIQCLYDFQKIGDELSAEYKKTSQKFTYICRELKNKEIIEFSIKKRNEYTEIMKDIYDYAAGLNQDENIVIGNLMRRVLEAFATFVYKKGISEISCDYSILNQMQSTEYTDYFKNLMYRLVLNGDSHMLERTNSLQDVEYSNFLSDEEKKRTAQDVICFIYLLNEKHILAHLEGKADFEYNIKKWCKNIKKFYSNDD